MTVIIIIILGLLAYIVKTIISLNILAMQITKAKEVNKTPNKLEKNYQFIKGLF